MIKITATVEGMTCGMCEAHINDAVRQNFKVKKVTSSHSKGKTEIGKSGYTVTGIHTEPYEKKGFSLFHS
ncbi:hypothetical protein IMSAG013_00897 [Clostridiales bacterium]|nr:hypothetical protein IMSAG013_00897 [Clostridiales bacterium]